MSIQSILDKNTIHLIGIPLFTSLFLFFVFVNPFIPVCLKPGTFTITLMVASFFVSLSKRGQNVPVVFFAILNIVNLPLEFHLLFSTSSSSNMMISTVYVLPPCTPLLFLDILLTCRQDVRLVWCPPYGQSNLQLLQLVILSLSFEPTSQMLF